MVFGEKMSDIGFEALITEIKQLKRYTEELLEIRLTMLCYKEQLEETWVANETEMIYELIDEMNQKIKWVTEELYGIEHDIVKRYEELAEEEVQ